MANICFIGASLRVCCCCPITFLMRAFKCIVPLRFLSQTIARDENVSPRGSRCVVRPLQGYGLSCTVFSRRWPRRTIDKATCLPPRSRKSSLNA